MSFTCRKANVSNPLLCEPVIPFGGYVALYEIDDDRTLTMLAVHPQREDDYH